MNKIITFSILASAAMASAMLTSCDGDPDNIYGKNKEMQILDEYGNVATHAYASIISGTRLNIVGGMGNNHIVEVEDESVLTASYSHRGAGDSYFLTVTYPAAVNIEPKKSGSTTVSITDSDIDKTIHVLVKVVDEYAALTIMDSNVEGMEDGMMLAFSMGDDNGYHIVSKTGQEYSSSENGEYQFGSYEMEDNHLLLTLKDGGKETTWKITDADNNKEGHQYYIPDIIYGLNLPGRVMTKYSPALNYPSIFLFSDVSDPERNFKTGPSRSTIKYTF